MTARTTLNSARWKKQGKAKPKPNMNTEIAVILLFPKMRRQENDEAQNIACVFDGESPQRAIDDIGVWLRDKYPRKRMDKHQNGVQQVCIRSRI